MKLASFKKVQERPEYTLYEWAHALKTLPMSGLRMFDIDKDLMHVVYLASRVLSQVKGRATVTFYGYGGYVCTLVPKGTMYDLLDYRLLFGLSSILQEHKCFWYDIPEMFPINETNRCSEVGLGQIVVGSSDEMYMPLINVSYIQDLVEYNCSERFDDTVIRSDYCLLENAYLKLRAFSHFMGTVDFETIAESFGIDMTFDKMPPALSSDVSEKYCLQRISVILDEPEMNGWNWDWVRRFKVELRSLNIANFGSTYPIEYDIVKVGSCYQLLYFIYKSTGLEGGRKMKWQ